MNENYEDFLNEMSCTIDYLNQQFSVPKYYEERSIFDTLLRSDEIEEHHCNLKMMKRMINFIVEKFKERGICADVIIIDEKRKYSTKHNRKTEEDMTTIKELIDKGLNNSDIEHITGITRKTVAKYRKRFK